MTLTRRALGTRLAGLAAAIGFGQSAAASVGAQTTSPLDPELRDAALRGLALASHRGDPVAAASAEATLVRLAETDPEAGLLGRIYQLLDVRPATYWHDDLPQAATADLATLHGAIRTSRPVAFGYTDLSGKETTRTVLPLALVHPPQGVKLLAWCGERKDFRQFFVRAMKGLTLEVGDFSGNRLALLQGLLDKEAGRA
ncbi:helix-turn-helix transcriptional regulator [Gemmobacter denitrificans]|uniref:helix-turn-helix transcriptional regulator n=1 Tax=Gemmobacter denitrificans TaxID=3123040 RepID=UPI002FFFD815